MSRSKTILKVFFFWRWRRRYACHDNPFVCCQYTDDPNDNPPEQ